MHHTDFPTMDDFDVPIARKGALPEELSSCVAPLYPRSISVAQDAAQTPPETGIIHAIRRAFHGRVWQSLAILFCVLFGIAMIANTQMSGEAFWFWYALFLHGGAKLYADLHFVLQPLYVLQTDAWIQLFGTKCLVTEIPSVFEVIFYCLAMLLMLRESPWPDWQKSIVLASAFFISIQCSAYRFDDYHIVTDTYIFCSMALLLVLARTDNQSRQLGLVAALGVLSGFTITSRLNDGAALLVATCMCLLFLIRTRKLLPVSLFVAAAVLTVIVVVRLTGDSLSSYVSNSVIKAAGAKGGGGNILAAPFLLFRHALKAALHILPNRKRILFPAFAIAGTSAIVWRYWKVKAQYIFLVQIGILATFCFFSRMLRAQMWSGELVSNPALFMLVLSYLLAGIVAVRFLRSRIGKKRSTWDSREILVLVPLAELASASASTAAQIADGFLFAQVAMLVLLVPVLQPFRKQAVWLNPSFLTVLVLVGMSGMLSKIWNPYSWLNFRSSPMFVNRQLYDHPVWGPMYLDRDLLHFVAPVCSEIAEPGKKPELLSMPYSYPNYFCDTPPWHGYVQTFFDTSSRSTIDHLMQELDSAPPQWIVYQRQLKVMWWQESVLRHGQPLAQRDLDTMIMQKIATGKWRLIDKRNYLEGDGWLIIKTRP